MQVTITRTALLDACKTCEPFAADKPISPELGFAEFTCQPTSFQVHVTNLSQRLVYTWQPDATQVYTCTEPNRFLAPIKLLTEWLRIVNTEIVKLDYSADQETLRLTCGSAKTSLRCLPVVNYPVQPPIFEPGVRLSASLFLQACNLVRFATSDNPSDKLSGVNFVFTPNQLQLQATDRFRLALQGLPTEVEYTRQSLLPANALNYLVKLFREPLPETLLWSNAAGEQVAITFSQANITFAFYTNTLAESYPPVTRLVPDLPYNITLPRNALARALAAAQLIARDNNGRVTFTLDADGCLIAARSTDNNEATEFITCTVPARHIFTANVKYLTEWLRVLTCSDITLSYAANPRLALVFRATKNATQGLYLVAPMEER